MLRFSHCESIACPVVTSRSNNTKMATTAAQQADQPSSRIRMTLDVWTMDTDSCKVQSVEDARRLTCNPAVPDFSALGPAPLPHLHRGW